MPPQIPLEAELEEAPSPVPEAKDPSKPLKLSDEAEKILTIQLDLDLRRLTSLFEGYRKRIKEFRELYEGTVEPKWEPFTDSSKVFVPLPKVIKDTAHARIFQTLFQQKEVAIVETSLEDSDVERIEGFDLYEALKAYQRAINKLALTESELNLKEKADAIIDEICQTGTVNVRVAHDKRVVPNKLRYNRFGEIEENRDFVESDQVVIDPIPVESAVWDITSDASELKLFAYDYHRSRAELEIDTEFLGWKKEKAEKVLSAPETLPSPILTESLKREGFTPVIDETIRRTGAGYLLTECYLRNFQVRRGVWADIVVTFHKKTATILRVILWPYIHNMMPVVSVNYETVRLRPIGRGAIEPIGPIAAGVNAITNQTINAATIRDNPGLVVPEGSAAHERLEAGWYPGIIIPERRTGEVRTVEFAQAGNTQASLALMDRLFQIAFQVSHLGPSQFGDVSTARRAPGNLGLSILQQGAELIDKIINRFRVAMGRILLQATAIYWQTNRRKFRAVVGPEDEALIERLMTSVGIDNLRVTLAVTSATHSKELDRQNYLSMIQTVLGYEQQVLALVGQMESGVDPKTGQPLPPRPIFNAVALEVLKDSQNLVTRWIESFPMITDAGTVVADAAGIVEEAQSAMNRITQQLGQLQQNLQRQGLLAPGGPGGGLPGGGELVAEPPGIGPGAGAILPGGF